MAGNGGTGKDGAREELLYIFEELYRRGCITGEELEKCMAKIKGREEKIE